jgi:hypothetical protein
LFEGLEPFHLLLDSIFLFEHCVLGTFHICLQTFRLLLETLMVFEDIRDIDDADGWRGPRGVTRSLSVGGDVNHQQNRHDGGRQNEASHDMHSLHTIAEFDCDRTAPSIERLARVGIFAVLALPNRGGIVPD